MPTIIRRSLDLTTPPLARWTLPSETDSALRDELARLDLDRAELLKTGPHRSVYRLGRWIVKISTRPVLRSRARRETRRLLGARAGGLDVPRPVAWAVAGSHEWLVLERVSGRSAAEATADARGRRRLAAEIGHAVRRLHDAGWHHRDLHLGNLWIDGERLVWLDASALTRLWLARPLARLAAALPPSWSRVDRWRAALGYFGDRGRARAWARRGRFAVERARRRIWRRRTRRCVRLNRTFEPIASGELRGWARRDRPAEAGAWVETLEQGQPDPTLETLKQGRTTAVFATSDPPLVLKRYRRDGGFLRRHILGRLAPTRARRAWLRYEALAVRHLPVPAAWAELEQPRGSARRSWIVTERLDAVGLDEAWQEAGAERRSVLLDRSARLIARLHARGASCRDLKAANLLVGWSDRLALVWLIDPDGVREHRLGPSRRRCVRDLARLNASFRPGELSLRERLRWLRRYARSTGWAPRRSEIQRIARATLRRWRRWDREAAIP